MKTRINLLFFIIFSILSFAQAPSNDSIVRKKITAVRIDKSVKIDGNLDEDIWKNIPVAKDFVELRPNNGKPENQDFKSEVKVMYDDTGIYIGAMLYDKEPSKISRELTERDGIGNDDFFVLFINGYNDKQQSLELFVTAAGVQADSKFTTDNGEDFSWNGIWYSGVKILENGWSVEMKIPFSELRFPKNSNQDWGVNFFRQINRNKTAYTWNHVNNQKSSFLLYDGVLENIKNINPPTRLSFLPYFSTYVNNYDGKTTTNINGGMDVKYGINEAFTLDTTLIPDFGQTSFDPTVLNLTPFEQQYQEQRSFFTEGTELFSKGNMFYSRRVGGAPSYYPNVNNDETVTEYPGKVKLLNATKISGRTKKGLGIGVFNGITEKMNATIKNEVTGETRQEMVEPAANYNVIVLDQRFRENSSITFVNTNTMRTGNAKDANASAFLYDITNKKNTFNFSGGMKGSWNSDENSKLGLNTFGGYQKISGKHRFGSMLDYVDKNYNVDDLGYTGPTNYMAIYNNYSYRYLQPKGNINNLSVFVNVNYKRRINPDIFYRFNINTNLNITNKKFQSYGGGFYVAPFGENDIYEPRAFGRHLDVPAIYNYWIWYESDSRKKFYYNINLDNTFTGEKNRTLNSISFFAKYRVSDHFSVYLESSLSKNTNNKGFAGNDSSTGEIFIGKRDVRSIVNSLTSQYTFNDKMMINLAFRHYFSDVAYKSFYTLQEDGTLADNSVFKTDDTTFNAWNLDLRYSWWFAPGSQLTLMYRNAVNNYLPISGLSYKDNIDKLFNEPIANNISLRITYFLDYNRAKNWFKKS